MAGVQACGWFDAGFAAGVGEQGVGALEGGEEAD